MTNVNKERVHKDPESMLMGKLKEGVTEAAPKYNPLLHTKKLPIRIRQADEGDVSFIYSSWLRSYASQNKDQPKLMIYDLHREVVSMLLETAITLVACMKDDENHILGWMCAQRIPKFLVLHYCYTKDPFRKLGIARTLLNAFEYARGEPIVISHKGYIVKDLKEKFNFLYIPHLQKEGALAHMEEIYDANTGTTTDG